MSEIKKNKIAIITHELYPVLSGGAIYVEKIANELGMLGFEVEVLGPKITNFNSIKTENRVSYKIIRFACLRRSISNASFFDHIFFLVFGFPQIFNYINKNKFDINICLFAIPSGILGYFLKLFKNMPYISIVDGADIPKIKSDMSFIINFTKPLFKKVNSFSDAVILLDGLEDVALPLLSNNNIYSMSCGIDLPNNQPNPRKGDHILELLAIGRLTKRKGFDLIIEACAIVKRMNNKFHLTIIGYGSEQQNLAEKILHLKLGNNISLTGRVEYENLATYYKNADCYIFFGDREGQSLAMMDALAYGLPVICSNHSGNTMLVKNNSNGIVVDYPNITKLADSILYFIVNRKKLEKMGFESKKIAKRHSWRNVAIKYQKIICKVLSDKKK